MTDSRLRDRRMMLERWELESDTPADRIKSFIDILIVIQWKIMQYGCPVGTLRTELAKLSHSYQFMLLGRAEDADALAMHLLARSQGVAALANAFHDQDFVQQEVQQLYDWLQSVSPPSTPRPRSSVAYLCNPCVSTVRTGFARLPPPLMRIKIRPDWLRGACARRVCHSWIGFGPLLEVVLDPLHDRRASMQAMTCTAPPHWSHVPMSILNARLKR